MPRNSLFILGILTFVILCVAALYGLFRYEKDDQATAAFANVEWNVSEEEGASAHFSTFENAQYGFALAHPQELQVQQYKEAAGSMTITFDDPQSDRDFQIFVLPYRESQIASSRIEKDTKGTAKGTPEEIIIGSGVRALLFESNDPLLGSLREVWFISSGFLYEVTLPVGHDEWIAGILWTFKPL